MCAHERTGPDKPALHLNKDRWAGRQNSGGRDQHRDMCWSAPTLFCTPKHNRTFRKLPRQVARDTTCHKGLGVEERQQWQKCYVGGIMQTCALTTWPSQQHSCNGPGGIASLCRTCSHLYPPSPPHTLKQAPQTDNPEALIPPAHMPLAAVHVSQACSPLLPPPAAIH